MRPRLLRDEAVVPPAAEAEPVVVVVVAEGWDEDDVVGDIAVSVVGQQVHIVGTAGVPGRFVPAIGDGGPDHLIQAGDALQIPCAFCG